MKSALVILCLFPSAYLAAETAVNFDDPNLAHTQNDVTYAAASCVRDRDDRDLLETCLRTQGLTDPGDLARAAALSRVSPSSVSEAKPAATTPPDSSVH